MKHLIFGLQSHNMSLSAGLTGPHHLLVQVGADHVPMCPQGQREDTFVPFAGVKMQVRFLIQLRSSSLSVKTFFGCEDIFSGPHKCKGLCEGYSWV